MSDVFISGSLGLVHNQNGYRWKAVRDDHHFCRVHLLYEFVNKMVPNNTGTTSLSTRPISTRVRESRMQWWRVILPVTTSFLLHRLQISGMSRRRTSSSKLRSRILDLVRLGTVLVSRTQVLERIGDEFILTERDTLLLKCEISPVSGNVNMSWYGSSGFLLSVFLAGASTSS